MRRGAQLDTRSLSMNSFTMCLFAAVLAVACAEPPSGYNYQRPSGGGSLSNGGSSSSSGGFGGGISSGGGSSSSSFSVSSNEGANVDPEILEMVRQIVLRSEASGGSGGVTSEYGVPAARVVDVTLHGVKQAIQVAEFQQTSRGEAVAQPQGGYPRGPASSQHQQQHQQAPSNSYGSPL